MPRSWGFGGEGVAFYQSERSDDRRIIRCHGRRVYEQALVFFGQRLAPQR